MAERMVQVPESLIEGLLNDFGNRRARAMRDARALLSQPTPTASESDIRLALARRWLNIDRSDGFEGLHAILFGPLPSGTSTAEPPRIEDMAPGTMFTAQMIGSNREHRLTAPNFGVQYHVADHDVWIHRRDIDPSTIRDVTPPPTTPEEL